MKSVSRTTRLSEVAVLNPALAGSIADDDLVSFLPMSAVDAESAVVVDRELRQYRDVRKGYTPLATDDVLVAKITPCFENGKIARAQLSRTHGFGSTEFHVIRADSRQLDPQYLVHFLRQSSIKREGEMRMTGSGGQRRVPRQFLADLSLSVPPLAEQWRIAEILNKADALRARRRAAVAQVDTLTQSIFLDMFGDPIGNPRHWSESASLGDVADIASGITKGRKVGAVATRSVPYLAVANVQDRALDLSVVKHIDATQAEILRYALKQNDLLLTEGGDPGKLGRGTLWNGELPECIHQNHIFRVRLKSDDVDPVFLNWLVSGARGKNYFLKSAKQTTGIASINMTQLRGFPLLVPPLTLQREFAKRVRAVGVLRERHVLACNEVDVLFASLQHRAFRGEL